MDRRFEISLNGNLYAELQFNYAEANKGEAVITTYKTEAVKGENMPPLPVTVPDKRYLKTFSHAALNSIAEVMGYDLSFCRDEFGETVTTEETSLFYHPGTGHARFRVRCNGEITGLINIYFSFPDNYKELTFLSASRISEDVSLPSDSLECNTELVKRLVRENFSAAETSHEVVS